MADRDVADLDLPTEVSETPATEPGAETQGQAQSQTQEQPWDSKTAFEQWQRGFEEKFNNFGRELGQSRSAQSRLDKLERQLSQSSQTQNTPEALSKLSPQERAESLRIVEELWKEKFGKDWEGMQEFKREQEIERNNSRIEGSAKSILGADYEKYEPIMGGIVAAAKKAAEAGSEDAEEFLEVLISKPNYGARTLVAMAKEEFAKGQANKSAQATEAQKAKGAGAASTVPGGVQRGISKPDPSKMSIAELREAAEKEARGEI